MTTQTSIRLGRPRKARQGGLFQNLVNKHQIWEYYGWEDYEFPSYECLYRPVRIPEDHPASCYLENRSHDAGIISAKLNDSTFELVINDYEVWRLSQCMEEFLHGTHPRVNIVQPRFPVTLRFSGLQEFKVYQTNHGGRLSRLRASARINLEKSHEYCYDKILVCEPDRFACIIMLRPSKPRLTLIEEDISYRAYHDHRIVLAIDTRLVEVIEEQRQAWQGRYGEATLPAFDNFVKIRKEVSGWGIAQIDDFLLNELSRLKIR